MQFLIIDIVAPSGVYSNNILFIQYLTAVLRERGIRDQEVHSYYRVQSNNSVHNQCWGIVPTRVKYHGDHHHHT